MTAVAYIAVDLETTGLDPQLDPILEVAWAPLGARFDRLGPTMSLVAEISPTARERLMANEYTKTMHQGNGLIGDALSGGLPLAAIEQVIMASADQWDWDASKLTIFGSSVHFDLRFIQAQMPKLAEWLHYRVLDVTTLLSFASAAGAWPDDQRAIAHRAAADIDWSIETAQKIFARLNQAPQGAVAAA